MDFYILSLLITLLFKNIYGYITDNPRNIWQLCQGISGGSFPYPSECTKFIECDQGKPVLKICGPGNVYNPALRLCDWPYNVPECSGALGGENYLQKNIIPSQPNLQNGGNQQLNQSPELNNNQNNQALNNEQQFIADGQNYSLTQNGIQNIKVEPEFSPVGNVEKPNDTLIYIPAQQSQSKWANQHDYLIFDYNPQQTNNNQAYPFGQSVNQPNGHKGLGIQQNNYLANGGNKIVNEQQTQDQQQLSKNRNSIFTLLEYKQNGTQVYEPSREGNYDELKNHIRLDNNLNSPFASNIHKNGHGYGHGQNLINQDGKQNNQFNHNKRQADSNENQLADTTWNNDYYNNDIDVRDKKKNEQSPAWTRFNRINN